MKVKHHNQEIGEGTVRLIHIDSIVATGGHFAHKTCAETVLQMADFFWEQGPLGMGFFGVDDHKQLLMIEFTNYPRHLAEAAPKQRNTFDKCALAEICVQRLVLLRVHNF